MVLPADDKPIYSAKHVPDEALGKWRSIEFELIFNSPKELEEFIAFVEQNKYEQFITVKDDHSIEWDYAGNVAKEVVVTYCAGKKKETENKYPRTKIVWDVCGFLKGRAYVNLTCGTHVHFDMRGKSKEQVVKFGERLAFCVPALKRLLPPSRRHNEKCHDVINSIDGDGDTFELGYANDRYCFINMQAYNTHKTIEVRGHGGTLNARKILNWIKVCEKIMVTKKPHSKTHFYSPQQLIEHYKFDKELVDYINDRNLAFNPPRDAQPAPTNDQVS